MAFGRLGSLGTGFAHLGAVPGGGVAAPAGGAALLVGEANGFATDFTYATNASRVAVKTAGTVVSSGLSFFTNAGTSSKWVYDVAGTLANVAVGSLAVDYDPATHVAKGLLVEPAATNLYVQSNDLSAFTAEGGTVSVNNQTGPDGALTADTFTEDTATINHGCYGSVTVTANTDYTVSRYMKMGTRRYASLGWSDGTNGAYAVYDLQSGIVGSSAAFGTGVLNSASIQACPNGWYRCVLSGKHPSATGYLTQQAATAATITADSFGRQIFLGTGSTLFMGHVQVEAGTVATSPIPTAGAQVTRAADNISFLLSAIPAISTEFTLYGRWQTPSIASARLAFCVTDNLGTPGDYAGFLANTTANLSVVDGTVSQCNAVTVGSIVAGTPLSIAGRSKLNDFSVSKNGAAVVTDVAGTQPIVTHVRFGNTGGNAAATAQFWVEKMVILPRGMSNAELVVRSAT